ncbi:MAG: hypothetical protein AAF572_10640 [Cyanobacteria bacterium P01_B01_bin.77]
MSATHAQVATIQSVESFLLEIETPYTTFSSPQPAVLSLQINSPASLVVSPPVPNGFSDPGGTEYSSFIRYNNAQTPHNTALSINTIGTVDIEVGLQVVRPQAYSVGNYSYDVLLTIAPK